MLNAIVAGVALVPRQPRASSAAAPRPAAPIAPGAELPQLGLGGSSANASIFLAALAVAVVWWLRVAHHLGAGVARRRPEPRGGAHDRDLGRQGPGRGDDRLGRARRAGRRELRDGPQARLRGRARPRRRPAPGSPWRCSAGVHPVGVALAALVLGFLSAGGLAVADLVPKELIEMLPGVVVLAVAAAARVGAPRGGRVVTEVLAAIFSLAFVAQVLRIAVPYALAAMGGAVTERAGRDRSRARGQAPVRRVRRGRDRPRDRLGAARPRRRHRGRHDRRRRPGRLRARPGRRSGDRRLSRSTWSAPAARASCSSSCSARARTRRRAPRTASAVLANPIVWLTAVRRDRRAVRAAPHPVGRPAARRRRSPRRAGRGRRVADPGPARRRAGRRRAGRRRRRPAVARGRRLRRRHVVRAAATSRSRWSSCRAGGRRSRSLACIGVAAAEALSIAFQVTGVPVAHELIALLPYATTLAVLIIFRGDRRAPPRSLGRI